MTKIAPQSRYEVRFCADLIDHMKNGYSFTSFSATLYDKYKVKIGRTALFNWVKLYPEFAEAKEIGESRALKFLEKHLRVHVTGYIPPEIEKKQNKKMSVTMVVFALKTRFYREYGDQLKLQGVENGEPITVVQEGAPPPVIVLPDNGRVIPKPEPDEK